MQLQLKTVDLRAKLPGRDKIGEVSYNVTVLGSTLQNKVLKVGGSSGIDSVLYGGYLANGIPVTQSRIGLPIGAFYGYKTNGAISDCG